MSITITGVTTGAIDGPGIFDTMMRSVAAHLKQQYEDRYIRDEDYATVYSNGLVTTLQQAVAYQLGVEAAAVARLQAEATILQSQAEIDLIRQRILTEKGQVEEVPDGIIGRNQSLLDKDKTLRDIAIQIEGENLAGAKGQTNDVPNGTIGLQQDLTAKQIAKENSEIALIDQRLLSEQGQVTDISTGTIGKQQALLGKQVDAENTNIQLLGAKVTTEAGQTTNMTTGLIGKQQANLGKEGNLLDQRLATETGQTQDYTTGMIGKQQALLAEQVSKTVEEKALILQKKVSEQAATIDISTGTIGKQQALYMAQREGFFRNAEQAAAKIFAGAFSVQRGTDAAFSPAGTGLENANIQVVMDKLRSGVGA